jgi:hypothetical protein
MQPDKPDLPPGWKLPPGIRRYIWTDPEKRSSPDVYIDRLGEDWRIEYWVARPGNWIHVLVPLTPDPPFELAEALYYAAQ